MPGMTGLELLPKAKAVRPDVPVIMITAYGDAETKRKALEAGAEALFTKPIDFGTLRGEIETRVERAPEPKKCNRKIWSERPLLALNGQSHAPSFVRAISPSSSRTSTTS